MQKHVYKMLLGLSLVLGSCRAGNAPSSVNELDNVVTSALTADGGVDAPSYTVSIESPASGTSFYETLQVVASVADLPYSFLTPQLLVNGVATVNGRVFGVGSQRRFGFLWEAGSVTAGNYDLTVLYTDPVGTTHLSPPVTVTLKHTTVSLASLVLSPKTVLGGSPSTATLTLSAPAPSDGLAVALPIAYGSWVTFPTTAFVPGGSSSTTFVVTTIAVPFAQSATVSAVLRGTTKSDTLSITPTAGVQSVSFSTQAVEGGTSFTGTVTLNQTFATDSVVSLTSDNAALVVPATVTITAGQLSATFPVTTTQVPRETGVVVQASFPSNLVVITAIGLEPSPTPASLVLTPNPVLVGNSAVATVTLTGPARAGGALVTVVCSNDFRLTFRTVSLTIPAGAQSGQVPFLTLPEDAGFSLSCVAQFNSLFARSSPPLAVGRNLSVGNAGYDSVLTTPVCNTVQASCDTGGLIDGADNLTGGPESHSPNTIYSSCLDDPEVLGDLYRIHYHFTGSVDRMKVYTSDGSALAAGKTVNIETTVWGVARLDLFTAPDATNPVWTFLTSIPGGDRTDRAFVLSTTFTLPTGSLQAIRASYGNGGSPAICAPPQGGMVDRDDLVFATDNGGTPTNIGPTVNAGPDQVTGLPPTATLAGIVADDGLPNPPAALTVTWSKQSGPGTVTFADPTAANTTAKFGIAGVYVLQLTASDGALSSSDLVTINVNPGGATSNQAPLVNAGADQTIALPDAASLFGVVTDDGLPNPPAAFTSTWTQVTGPGLVTFANPNAAATTVTFPVTGTYTLRLTANDGLLLASDDVVLTVNPVPPINQPPVVNAGVDQTITLPAVVSLTGTAVDDGLPVPPGSLSISWSLVGGPGSVGFTNVNAVATTATFSTAGSYTLRLTANDGVLSSNDDVVVTVNPVPPVNKPPVVNAGADQTITLPAAANLVGTASDDGLPSPPATMTVAWSKISGPGTVSFATPTAKTTSATFSVAGSYILRLTANDGALATVDDITITVKAAVVNHAPVVNAGADQTITLPAVANLVGTVSDDGLPTPPAAVTLTWSKVSGPGAVTFGNTKLVSTSATFSSAGSYVLRLSASDGALSATDDIAITVKSAGLKLQYRVSELAPKDNVVKPHFNIVNTGTAAVPLNQLKIRYWYTIDGSQPQTANCDWAQIGCAKVTQTFTTLNPTRTNADRYLEVGFTSSAGNLAAGAQTGELQLRFNKNNFSNFNENNDYSYATSSTATPPTSLADWTRVTLYRNGVVVWGTEP